MKGLKPSLGSWTSVSLVVGGIIGSGIFMKPALMAAQVGSPLILIGVWIVAGILSLVGALANAEIATMIPETGGQYIYFRKMYGDVVAFLYGWSAFVVFNTAGVASIAYVFGTYAGYFIPLPTLEPAIIKAFAIPLPLIGTLYPLDNIGVKAVTMAVIIFLTLVNYHSTRAGGQIQVVFTFLKIGAMGILVLGLFVSDTGSASNLFTNLTSGIPEGWLIIPALTAALSGAFWGYDGWNNITFVAGEIKNPSKDIPKSLLTGLLICICIYSIITISYIYILGMDSMAQSSMVATDAATAAFGALGGTIIGLMVIISTFGTTNGNILATARVTFAMATEKQLFRSLGTIHPRYQTPGNALLVHGIWTCILVMSGSFDMLTDMLVFVSWLFYGLGVAGLFVLRFTMKNHPRPYKMWGYPWLPALFLIFCIGFLGTTLWNDIQHFREGTSELINSVLGLVLTISGLPVYYYFRKHFSQE